MSAIGIGLSPCMGRKSAGAAAPTISSFTPAIAAKQDSVVITGANFTGATAVKIGGTDAASFSVDSATQITAVVAAGTTGTIAVTTAGGTATSSGTLTYCDIVTNCIGEYVELEAGTFVYTDTGLTTPATADGNAVKGWKNRNGTGGNLTSSVGGVLKTNIKNSRSVVRFDGITQLLQKAAFVGGSLSQPYTIFIIYIDRDGAAGKDILSGGDVTADVEFFVRLTNSHLAYFAGTTTEDNPAIAVDTNWHIASIVFNGTSSKTRHDGGAEATTAGTTNTQVLSGLTLGAFSDGSSAAAVDIMRCYVFSGEPSAGQKTAMFNYLNQVAAVY